MHKTLSMITALVLFSYAAQSQTQFGLKAGLNFANQVKTVSIPNMPTISQNTEPFVGYQIGLFTKIPIVGHLSFATEANFSVVGSTMTLMSADLVNYNITEKIGYIDLPLFLQYSISKFYVGMGPSVGLKLYSKLMGFQNGTFNTPDYKTLEFSGNMLAGLSVSEKVDVHVRYCRGYTNLYKDPGNALVKNRFLNFSVLYNLK